MASRQKRPCNYLINYMNIENEEQPDATNVTMQLHNFTINIHKGVQCPQLDGNTFIVN